MAQHCKEYGYFQPLAFLGVWIEKARDFDGRQGHVALTPTLKEISDFMSRMNWPKQSIRKEDFQKKII